MSCWGEAGRFAGNPPRVPFKDVATAYATSCGIQINGDLNCWGDYLPRQENKSLPKGSFLRVEVSSLSLAQPLMGAIRADGTLSAWKRSDDPDPRLPMFPSGGQFTDLIVSELGFLCALYENGSVGCWDRNGVLATPTGTFMQLESQWWSGRACAVDNNRGVVCWNPYNVLESTQLPGSFVEIAFGSNHGCGRSIDGKISCWGSDTTGQTHPPNERFVQVSAGFDHTCALDLEQRPWCWGDYVLHPM